MTDMETARTLGGDPPPHLPEFDTPPEGPWELLRSWLDGAVRHGVRDPYAAVVATADAHGRPSTRTLHLAELDGRGLLFGGSRDSRKGRELAARPWASATFFWRETFQQLTVDGSVERLTPAESDRLFAQGPREALAASALSEQSEPLRDEAALRERTRELADADDGPVARPERWSGYRLLPETVEFWHGSPDRLHRRLRYDRVPAPHRAWTHQRLQP
jgi:pyridoxamine 5'-phosphate oxidase